MLAQAAGLGIVIGIGIVLGGLGGGGGVLVVPALVYVLGQTAQDATTSSVIIVGITAITGALGRLRGGLIDWQTGLTFGVVGIPTAYLGTQLNRHVAQDVLLLAFSALTLITAAVMLVDSRRHRGQDPEQAVDPGPSSGTRTLLTARLGARTCSEIAVIAGKVLLCGLAVGFLTGFLGVGGGFLVVPALVIVLRTPMTFAVGTSLMIIALNSVTSFVSRLGVAEFDWKVIVPFTVAAIVGAVVGKRLADRLSGTLLTRAFAIMLMVVGGLVAAQSLGAF